MAYVLRSGGRDFFGGEEVVKVEKGDRHGVVWLMV